MRRGAGPLPIHTSRTSPRDTTRGRRRSPGWSMVRASWSTSNRGRARAARSARRVPARQNTPSAARATPRANDHTFVGGASAANDPRRTMKPTRASPTIARTHESRCERISTTKQVRRDPTGAAVDWRPPVERRRWRFTTTPRGRGPLRGPTTMPRPRLAGSHRQVHGRTRTGPGASLLA